MKEKLVKCRNQLRNILETKLYFLPEILTRLSLGFMFAMAGWGKFQNLERTIGYFEHLNIPMASLQAPFVAFVELVGGADVGPRGWYKSGLFLFGRYDVGGFGDGTS